MCLNLVDSLTRMTFFFPPAKIGKKVHSLRIPLEKKKEYRKIRKHLLSALILMAISLSQTQFSGTLI